MICELSKPAQRVLSTLVYGQPKTRTQIAADTGIWKSNIGRYMEELERNGLVCAQRGGGKAVLYTPAKPPETDILFDVFVRRAKT